MKHSTIAIAVLSFLLFGWMTGITQKKPSEKEINAFIQQDLEKKRQEVTEWKERYNREYEARVHLEAQLSQLRSAVAKAAKL